jgi:hypothetical protein
MLEDERSQGENVGKHRPDPRFRGGRNAPFRPAIAECPGMRLCAGGIPRTYARLRYWHGQHQGHVARIALPAIRC